MKEIEVEISEPQEKVRLKIFQRGLDYNEEKEAFEFNPLLLKVLDVELEMANFNPKKLVDLLYIQIEKVEEKNEKS